MRINLIRPRYVWVTTGRATKYGEPLSWRLHAVQGEDHQTFNDIAWRSSACNRVAAWGLDLFIDKKCSACLRALGRACPACRGIGSTGNTLNDTWETCSECTMTGESREERLAEAARHRVTRLREERRQALEGIE